MRSHAPQTFSPSEAGSRVSQHCCVHVHQIRTWEQHGCQKVVVLHFIALIPTQFQPKMQYYSLHASQNWISVT